MSSKYTLFSTLFSKKILSLFWYIANCLYICREQTLKTMNFRSRVFKQAHQIRKETGKLISVCLVKAWAAYRLVKKMRTSIVKFSFEKKDGSLRYANGTLTQGEVKGTGIPNFKTVNYYDTDANGFRSFLVSNLLTIY